MKKFFTLIMILVFILTGCSSMNHRLAVLKIKGSDTMKLLSELLAEEYMKTHQWVSIYVEGGGTGISFQALSSGEADICTASRNLKSEEIQVIADQYSTLGISFLIAKDALSIYLNKNNPVNNLSLEQIRELYTCQITDWKDAGGLNEPVLLAKRNTNSGTYFYFKQHILQGDEYCNSGNICLTTNEIVEYVRKNRNAIGYGGIAFNDGIKHALVDGIEPTEENIRKDVYPISRYLHFYTLAQPQGAVKDFIDWVISPEGQKYVQKAGYIPIWNSSF